METTGLRPEQRYAPVAVYHTENLESYEYLQRVLMRIEGKFP